MAADAARPQQLELKDALGNHRADELTYVVFDLLHLDGRDLRLAAARAQAALQALLAKAPRGPCAFCHTRRGRQRAWGRLPRGPRGRRLQARQRRTVRSAATTGSRSSACSSRVRAGGLHAALAARVSLGSLILGCAERGRLRYAGRVGTGFDAAQRADLRRRLGSRRNAALRCRASRSCATRRGRPQLVGEVAFVGGPPTAAVTRPSGAAQDKAAKDVVVDGRARPAHRHAARVPHARSLARPRATASAAEVELASVRLRTDKPLWPDAGVTKADLARYFYGVARACCRTRPAADAGALPGGVGRGCFFQARGEAGRPSMSCRCPSRAVRHCADRAKRAALVSMAQISALELHIGGVRADAPRKPDRLVLDLDPAPDVPFARVMEAARELRRRLERDELTSFVMTTGGKGLHVVVPLERRHEIEEVAAYAAGLGARARARAAEAVHRQRPRRAARGASSSTARNARGATAIFSRARPGAPVAVPLAERAEAS